MCDGVRGRLYSGFHGKPWNYSALMPYKGLGQALFWSAPSKAAGDSPWDHDRAPLRSPSPTHIFGILHIEVRLA